MSYSVTLSNGKAFNPLTVSGDCYESEEHITADMFSGGMSKVIIRKHGNDEEMGCPFEPGEYTGLELGGVFSADGKSYFWFTRPSEEELARLKDRADIDYLAMMTGVEL